MDGCKNEQKNRGFCNCSYPGCPRKGVCCECLQYHLKQQQLPACVFSPDAEKTYDRSIAHFIEQYNKKNS